MNPEKVGKIWTLSVKKMVPKFSPAVTVWDEISKLGLTPLVCVSKNISTIKNCEILVMVCNCLM